MVQAGNAAAKAADVISFVDEAGDRGYLRKLTAASDTDIGVFCAVPIPVDAIDCLRAMMRPAFNRFCSAAPAGAKWHITDAFKPGHEAWAVVAREVRDAYFKIMLETQMRVVYVARRLGVARSRPSHLIG